MSRAERPYLIFWLYGFLAAWGDVAVGRRRPVLPHPSKSGVLGLCAAALGIRRNECEQLLALHAGCGFASRTDATGQLYVDFQTQAEDGVEHPALSYRDYRVNALARACLWAAEDAPYTLEQIAEALERPRFAPYLGRRCCVLGLPPWPRIVLAGSPTEALDAELPGEDLLAALPRDPSRIYRWEGAAAHLAAERQEVRRDRLLHPLRRQFGERLEWVAAVRKGEETDV